MNRQRSLIFVSTLVLLLAVNIQAQDDYAEISGVGYWTSTSDWEGDPLTLEWDGGFQYGVDGAVSFGNIFLSGRWMFGDFDNTGPGVDDTWSLKNLEVIGGYRILDTPFSVIAAYKHWELDLDESRDPASSTLANLSFSFDGFGGGAGINWEAPDSGLFFNGHALYYFEVDSSLGGIDDRGFDRALTFNGEVGFVLEGGLLAAVGARFEQVHQDLPEEERVAPFADYGFEQTSITFRIGYRFGM